MQSNYLGLFLIVREEKAPCGCKPSLLGLYISVSDLCYRHTSAHGAQTAQLETSQAEGPDCPKLTCDSSIESSHTSKSLLPAADRPLAGQRSCVSPSLCPSALLEPLPLHQREGQTLLCSQCCSKAARVTLLSPGQRQLSCAI